MKITSKIIKYKFLIFIRLALLLVLSLTVFRTVMIVRGECGMFVPKSADGAGSQIPVVRKDSIGEPEKSPKSSIRDYSAIFEGNLFGNPTLSLDTEKQPKVDPNSNSILTKEEPEIALLGTVAGSPGISRAIIENLETNMLSLLRVGDTVGNAAIESIDKDTVVLLHQGQRKTVHLGNRESRRREVNNAESVVAKKPTRSVKRDPQDRPPTTAADKLRYAATMLPKAVIEPYVVDGNIEGLKITGLERIKQLQDLGLKNGDVIRTVNGHRLTSKQKAYQISKKVRAQAILSIELMRGKKIREFSFRLS